MAAPIVDLDKSLELEVDPEYGTITIRVVVLEKSSAPPPVDEPTPADVSADEVLPEADSKRPVDSYLETPKRGKLCCVFLINGQRQHAWDNTFVVRDLELKYLRNRMLVVVDVDGLAPHGHRQVGVESRDETTHGDLAQTQTVVTQADTSTGQPAESPLLIMVPDMMTVRLKPNDTRRISFRAAPAEDWSKLERLANVRLYVLSESKRLASSSRETR